MQRKSRRASTAVSSSLPQPVQTSFGPHRSQHTSVRAHPSQHLSGLSDAANAQRLFDVQRTLGNQAAQRMVTHQLQRVKVHPEPQPSALVVRGEPKPLTERPQQSKGMVRTMGKKVGALIDKFTALGAPKAQSGPPKPKQAWTERDGKAVWSLPRLGQKENPLATPQVWDLGKPQHTQAQEPDLKDEEMGGALKQNSFLAGWHLSAFAKTLEEAKVHTKESIVDTLLTDEAFRKDLKAAHLSHDWTKVNTAIVAEMYKSLPQQEQKALDPSLLKQVEDLVPKKYAASIQKVVNQRNMAIGARDVNKQASAAITLNFPTKPFSMKAKSEDKTGFIPWPQHGNPKFDSLPEHQQKDILKYGENVIGEGKLFITLKKDAIKTSFDTRKSQMSEEDKQLAQADLLDMESRIDQLGEQPYVCDPATRLPLVADIDLLSVSENKAETKKRKEQGGDPQGDYTAKQLPGMGTVNNTVVSLLIDLNVQFMIDGYKGGLLVHHGVEMHNEGFTQAPGEAAVFIPGSASERIGKEAPAQTSGGEPQSRQRSYATYNKMHNKLSDTYQQILLHQNAEWAKGESEQVKDVDSKMLKYKQYKQDGSITKQ